MPKFQPGDYVTAEFKDEGTWASERMWVQVDSCDDGPGARGRAVTSNKRPVTSKSQK